MRCCIAVFALAVVSLLAVNAAHADAFFDQLDKNDDNAITRDEMPPRMRSRFDRVDSNGDGSITLEEHMAFISRRRVQRQPRNGAALDDIKLIADVKYAATDNPRQRLDLLLPKTRSGAGPLPLLVYIHGGGWQSGSKNAGRRQVAPYVASGKFVGATLGYRLSGEATWPAQIHDVKAAIRWLRANADEHGIDPDNITVWGSSAGGHLAAMLGTTGDVPDLEGTLGGHADVSSKVHHVIDFFGPADLLSIGHAPSRIDHEAENSPESRLLGGPIQQNREEAAEASPVTHVSADDAVFLIMHGDDDNVVPFDQSRRMKQALDQADVEAVLVKVVNGEHGFRAPEVDSRVAAFLNRFALGEYVLVSNSPIQLKKDDDGPRQRTRGPRSR